MDNPGLPLISVVMPTYNHARFIGSAAGSVLRQSYTNFELIIVDNYSTDRTEEVVKSFGDPRIRYVKFSNGGVIAASRNKGITLAKGDYIAFLDSDDLWLPGKLEKQAALLSADDGTVLVYSRYRTIMGEEVSEEVFPQSRRCLSGDMFKALYLRHFIACSGVMAKKSSINGVGGFDEAPSLVAVEDMDLWLKLALSGRISCSSDEALFYYRIHGENSSRGYYKKYKRALHLLSKFADKVGYPAYCAAVALFTLSIVKQKLISMTARAFPGAPHGRLHP